MSILRTHSKPKTHIGNMRPAALQSLGWQDGQPILRPLPFRTYRGEIRTAFANRGAAMQRQSRSVPLAHLNVRMVDKFHHVPVMGKEIVDAFRNLPQGWVIDATLGGAGHACMILDECPQLSVIGFDQDLTAVKVASERLAKYGQRALVVHARFDSIAEVLTNHGISQISAALFDLGVSSHQFDEAERGFSYRINAPLDMRMNTTSETSAKTIVNERTVEELETLIREYSDEKFAHRIARAIVAARPINTTLELSEVIASAIPAPARRRGGHPAKRTFQAIRIAVNSELEILEPALTQAIDALNNGGRIAVLSYHSGEDRIVKSVIRNGESGGCQCPVGLPCGCGAVPTLKRVRTAAKASPAEIESNPRSSSARLRVAEKINSGDQ